MGDRDLDALRGWRAGDIDPPAGMRERLEEDLLQVVLAEEERLRATAARSAPGRWFDALRRGHAFDGLARPALGAVLACTLALAVAVVSDGGTGPNSVPGTTGGVRAASTNVLDAAAASLFGGSSAVAPAPIVGSVDMREFSGSERELAEALGAGPGAAPDLAAQLVRDPARLHALARTAAAEAGVPASFAEHAAFHVAMSWVVDTDVPADLRAAMLRSVEGTDELDRAVRGVDLLGRPGVVVSRTDAATGVREQYVLAPSTGELLERRAFTTAYVVPGCAPGTWVDHQSFIDGMAIAAEQVPWIDWPEVVRDCGPAALAASVEG